MDAQGKKVIVSGGSVTLEDLTPQDIADREVLAAEAQAKLEQRNAEIAREESFIDDADRADLLTRLQNATPAQIKTYINSTVTDLASAKTLLIKLALVIATLARR